jgi:hypothetical protein
MPILLSLSDRLRRVLRLLYVAAVIALTWFLLTAWIRERDNPTAIVLQRKGEVSYASQPIEVVLDCTCPPVLVEGKARSLPFKATLKRISQIPTPVAFVPEKIDVSLNAGPAVVGPEEIYIGDGQDLLKGNEITQSFSLKITPADTTLSQITFSFFSTPGGKRSSLGSIEWRITSQSGAWTVLAPYAYTMIIFATILGIFFWADRRMRLAREKAEQSLIEAKRQADANPEQARFAWDLARVKLEAYFDRNLIQVNLVFWLAVVVMAVGFSFVLAGIVLSYMQQVSTNAHTSTPIVAAVSGIITQFIGATFMVIYRSTMAQANEFMTVLERINNAGMAVQVLDALPEGTDLKNATRAQIAMLLLGTKIMPKAGSAGKASARKKEESQG